MRSNTTFEKFDPTFTPKNKQIVEKLKEEKKSTQHNTTKTTAYQNEVYNAKYVYNHTETLSSTPIYSYSCKAFLTNPLLPTQLIRTCTKAN